MVVIISMMDEGEEEDSNVVAVSMDSIGRGDIWSLSLSLRSSRGSFPYLLGRMLPWLRFFLGMAWAWGEKECTKLDGLIKRHDGSTCSSNRREKVIFPRDGVTD